MVQEVIVMTNALGDSMHIFGNATFQPPWSLHRLQTNVKEEPSLLLYLIFTTIGLPAGLWPMHKSRHSPCNVGLDFHFQPDHLNRADTIYSNRPDETRV